MYLIEKSFRILKVKTKKEIVFYRTSSWMELNGLITLVDD